MVRPPSASRMPRAVVLVTGLWVALLLGASLLWPPLTGYDEAMHVGMSAAYASSPTHLWDPGELTETTALRALRQRLPADPASTPYDALPLPARGDRPSFAALGGLTPDLTGAANQMVQHPPLAYLGYAALLRAPGVSGLAWDQQVWLLRLLSVLVAAPVPALAWATARRLLPAPGIDARPGRRPDLGALAIAAAVVPLTLPNLVRVCASVSNDVLLVLTTSVLLLGLARVVTGDLGRHAALLVGGGLAAALWTKGLALVLPPLVVVAYGWALRTHARSQVVSLGVAARRHRASLVTVLVGGVVGGLWWLRNVVLFHQVQVTGVGEAGLLALYGAPDGAGRPVDFIRGWPYLVAVRMWGGVGLPDTPVPSPLVVWGWPVLLVAALLVAVALPSRRPGARLGVTLVAWAPVLLTLLVVGSGSWSTYHRWSSSISGAQGRYLYPLVVGLAAGAVAGATRLRPRATRVLPGVLLVAALATQTSTWAMLLTSWFAPGRATSPPDLVAGFQVLGQVSPVPLAVTVCLVLVLPVAAALAGVAGTLPQRDNGV